MSVDVVALPAGCLKQVLKLLPPDDRARAACVQKSWRSAAADPALWTSLDLSKHGGVEARFRFFYDPQLLDTLNVRAGSGLTSLDVSGFMDGPYESRGMEWPEDSDEWKTIGAFVRSTCSLRHLKCSTRLDAAHVTAVLEAAPHLASFVCGVETEDAAGATKLLRGQPPFTALRVTKLSIKLSIGGSSTFSSETALLLFLSSLSSHAPLRRVCFSHAPFGPAALSALVDAACARRFTSLEFSVSLPPQEHAVTPLCRLLARNARLTKLVLRGCPALLLPPRGAQLWCAIRANLSLTTLSLSQAGVFSSPEGTAGLASLAGHPSIRKLRLSRNRSPTPGAGWRGAAAVSRAAGDALASLLRADTLFELDVADCGLGDGGLAPLFSALPSARKLATFVPWFNDLSEGLAAAAAAAVAASPSIQFFGEDYIQVNGVQGADRTLAAACGFEEGDMDSIF